MSSFLPQGQGGQGDHTSVNPAKLTLDDLQTSPSYSPARVTRVASEESLLGCKNEVNNLEDWMDLGLPETDRFIFDISKIENYLFVIDYTLAT